MGSKRSKKVKLEMELVDVKKETEVAEEHNGATVTSPRPEKRKKKSDEGDELPKKIRKVDQSPVKAAEPPAAPKKRGRKKKVKVEQNNVENCDHPNHGAVVTENKNNINDKKPEDTIWPEPDMNELISRMEFNIPEPDTLTFTTRVEKLNWDNVMFKNYSAEDCKKMWALVQKRLRKFRLLREVLNDARAWVNAPKAPKAHRGPRGPRGPKLNSERAGHRSRKHPDMPRRPLSSYLLFYLKKKNKIVSENPGLEGSEMTKLIGQKYKELPPEKREKYEKQAAIHKEEYLKELRLFFDNHPELEPPPRVRMVKSEKPPLEVETPPVVVESPPKPPKVEKPAKIEKPPKAERPPKPPKVEKEKSIKQEKDKPPKKCQTPFGLYFSSELRSALPETEKHELKDRCKEIWKQMTDKKKLYWITMAEQFAVKYEEDVQSYKEKHPEYEGSTPVRSILTKEEKFLKERLAGKPVKPPNSAYGLFSKKLLQSDEIKAVNPKERMNYIANKWKATTEEEKNSFKDKTIDLNEKYKADWTSYLDSLPEERRQEELLLASVKKKPAVVAGKKARTRKPRKRKEKKEPKAQKNKTKFKEPEQPPISACKYFATIYKGEEDPTHVWKSLSSQEKRKFEEELTSKKQAYIVEFEKFLKSLSKEELEAFSKSRQQAKSDDESSECSSESGGEDDDDDDGADGDEEEEDDAEDEPHESDTD